MNTFLTKPRIVGTCSHQFHECEQSLVVLVPAGEELLLGRESITAQLHGHLQAVGVKIVEVLHTWAVTEQNCFTQNPLGNVANPPPPPILIITDRTVTPCGFWTLLSQSQIPPERSWSRNLHFRLTACDAEPLGSVHDPLLTLVTRRSTVGVFVGHPLVGVRVPSGQKLENLQNKIQKLVHYFSFFNVGNVQKPVFIYVFVLSFSCVKYPVHTTLSNLCC